MDILYIYRRSTQEELELRYSLRSVARHLPYIGKVWIFGDRAAFLSGDQAIIEHVPQEYVAGIGNYRLPVVNFFLQIFLGSLIPNLAPEFLLFADDYVLLDFVPEGMMRTDRALENLSLSLWERAGVRAVGTPAAAELQRTIQGRQHERPIGEFRGNPLAQQAVYEERETAATPAGQPSVSLWHEALWRTIDLLARFNLPLYNFESHVPAYLTKARVLEAFCAFRDFITEDRLYGPLALTAILNLAVARGNADVVFLREEKSRAGFYDPADLTTIRTHCAGRKFLSFDEDGFNADMRRYLQELFPDASVYEAAGQAIDSVNQPAGLRPGQPRVNLNQDLTYF